LVVTGPGRKKAGRRGRKKWRGRKRQLLLQGENRNRPQRETDTTHRQDRIAMMTVGNRVVEFEFAWVLLLLLLGNNMCLQGVLGANPTLAPSNYLCCDIYNNAFTLPNSPLANPDLDVTIEVCIRTLFNMNTKSIFLQSKHQDVDRSWRRVEFLSTWGRHIGWHRKGV